MRSQFGSSERRVRTTESAFPASRTSSSLGFSSAPTTSQGKRYENGHDVFTGHWEHGRDESFPFFDGEEPFDENQYIVHDQQGTPSYHHPTQSESPISFMNINTDDNASIAHRSVKSIDTISDLDAKKITDLTMPPRSLMLAGSVCIILFAPGDQVDNPN
jgi:hypothetical protein